MASLYPANTLSHRTCSDECSQRPARSKSLPRTCVQPAFSRVVVLIHLRGLLPSTVYEGGKQEEYNAQVVCCCGLCVSRHNFGTSNNACAAPSAGRHDHASSPRMRPI